MRVASVLGAVGLSLVFLSAASAVTPPPTTVGGFGANATVTDVTFDAMDPAQNVLYALPGTSHSITATVTIPWNGYDGWYETPIGFEGASQPFDYSSCVSMYADDIPYTQTLAFTAPSAAGEYNVAVDQGMTWCDSAWHSSASTTIAVVVVDDTAPTVTLTTPVDGATYTLNQAVTADYGCTDDNGVATCDGTVADGSAIDTATLGSHAFTVDASDVAGNTATTTVHYNVVYSGAPDESNCVGMSTSALSDFYSGDLLAAAHALGFDTVKQLQTSIKTYCR